MKYQHKSFACGVASVQNVIRCFGKKIALKRIMAHSSTTREHGTNEHGIKNALERLGFIGNDMKGDSKDDAWRKLSDSVDSGFPVILLVDRYQHWVVAIGMLGTDRIVVFDSTRTKKNKSENGVHVYHKKHVFRRWSLFEGKYFGIVVSKSKTK